MIAIQEEGAGVAAAVRTPPDVLGKIIEELNSALAADEAELLRLVGFSEFLCCLSVLRRERVAGRLSVSQDGAGRAAELIEALGLHCRRSALDLLPQPDLIGGHVKHNSVYVPQGSRPQAWAILYIGVDAEFAAGAETAELNREQRLVGRLFGYPECCSEFFLRNDGVNQDRTPSSVTDAGPFPSILNPALNELYGFSLQFHFACSPRCARSLALARARLDYLKEYAPSICAAERLGAGITVYGPSTGAALVTRYRPLGGGAYEAEEVLTWDEKAAEVFSRNGSPPRIRLRAAHDFEIEGKTFNDEAHFAAVFAQGLTA